MRNHLQLLEDSLAAGAIAAVATTAAAALCGQLEEHEPVGPINAVSHIAWGDEAAQHDDVTLKYTATGAALNASAVVMWAGIQEFIFGGKRRPQTLAGSIAAGAAVSALAYVTDYHVVPKRLTPGFEKRLSNSSLAGMYGALAISLGIGNWLIGQRK